MDNAIGAKAAYPIHGSQYVESLSVVLASVNVGTFICAILYLPQIEITKEYALIPFIVIAPGMSSTYFVIYDVSNGVTASTADIPNENVNIKVFSSTDTITLQATPTKSYANQTVTINGCIVILA